MVNSNRAFRTSGLLVAAIFVVPFGPVSSQAAPQANAMPWFHDVTESIGVDFHHRDGRSGKKHYVETTASGGGWLDIDRDGDLDLYLINAGLTPGSTLATAPRNALYLNNDGRFRDVGAAAGVDDDAYGMGLCAGDVDADGRLDFLVTNFGPDRLYRNTGPDSEAGARFEEIGAQAGVDDARWSTGCAFGDLDGDGDLDLYVTHYVDFAYASAPACGDAGTSTRHYCQPTEFDGVDDALFINHGPGPGGLVIFKEEGEARGILGGATERGMGVALSDFDRDDDLDIYVTNDGSLNRLYINNGRGRFEEIALVSGAGLNALGRAEAGMGIAVGDADGDGWLDLVVSHFALETNTFYRNLGGSEFEDETSRVGLGRMSYKEVGWGIGLFDLDNDRDLDLAIANGHMQDELDQIATGLAYRQPNQVLENVGGDGRARFRDASEQAGPAFAVAEVSRGLAVGDWNNDGRLDLLITNTNDRPRVLENRRATAHHWLGVVLEGAAANPFAIGARVELEAGGVRQQHEVRSGGSFLSQSDLRLHFGLGNHTGPVDVSIRWPDGGVQRATTSELDRYWTIRYAPTPSESEPSSSKR